MSIPPVGSDPSYEPGRETIVRETITRDRTPERDEVQRTVTPVGRASAMGGNRWAAIAGGLGVVALLVFINVPRDKVKTTTTGVTTTTTTRPTDHAAQTVQYEPPNLNGTTTTTAMTQTADGRFVPAIAAGGAGAVAQPPGPPPPSAAQLLEIRERHAPLLVGGGGSGDAGQTPATDVSSASTGASSTPARAATGELDGLRRASAIGMSRAGMLPNRNYLVTAGTLIPCILQTAMNSTQPGYTSCLIPRDVFSDNGKVVLMEKGTKVLGQYQGGIQQGQNRIFVLWTRAVTPQGVAIDLASPASDALGRAGMAGAVDTFFWARFGAAILLSLVDDASSIASSHFAGQGTNTTQVPSSTAGVALQSTVNIKPVLKKNQGEEVAIFVAQDFNFADVYNLELRR